VAHPSDSKEHSAAEPEVLALLGETLGVSLAPKTLSLPEGARVDVDGVGPDESVLVEVFAHQGRLKGGQILKVAKDALKLITLARTRPEAKLVLAFADEAAAKTALGKGWLAEAIRTWGVEVYIAPISDETRAGLLRAQARQIMINPPVEVSPLRHRFDELLQASSQELFEENPGAMASGELLPTKNPIDDGDLELFFAAVDAGIVTLERGGRFNTADRPSPGGRWSLLSRSKAGGWFNAEYVPQLAAYADAILRLGYPRQRVLFELPSSALQLDLAILDDNGRVVVLGEAKRQRSMLPTLVTAAVQRFGEEAPDDDSKKRGDEARQLAWRLWTVHPALAWMIAPGQRDAYSCSYSPLELTELSDGLPPAAALGLAHTPPSVLSPPDLLPPGPGAVP